MNTHMKTLGFAVVASLAICHVAGAATSIGINFRGGNNAGAASVTLPAGVGVQSNWNNLDGASGTVGSLIDSSAAGTGASITWAGNGLWTTTISTATGNGQLLHGYVDSTDGTPDTYSVTGIPYGQYDVYAYVGSDGAGRTGHGTIGATSYHFSTLSTLPTGDFILTTDSTGATHPSANYMRFQKLTGSSFTFSLTRESSSVGLHGLQIVELQVPEPSTLMLLAMGLGGLVLAVRRHRAA